jgi:hypothetical protein
VTTLSTPRKNGSIGNTRTVMRTLNISDFFFQFPQHQDHKTGLPVGTTPVTGSQVSFSLPRIHKEAEVGFRSRGGKMGSGISIKNLSPPGREDKGSQQKNPGIRPRGLRNKCRGGGQVSCFVT